MRSRLPLCTIVGLLLLTASEAVIGQQVGCGGYVPTPTPPAALWDQLQPAGVIWNTSSYDGNKTLNSNLPAATGVDIENGILFTAYWAGYALFDLRNGPVPPPDPNGGRPAPLAMIDGWSGGFSPGIFINSTHNARLMCGSRRSDAARHR